MNLKSCKLEHSTRTVVFIICRVVLRTILAGTTRWDGERKMEPWESKKVNKFLCNLNFKADICIFSCWSEFVPIRFLFRNARLFSISHKLLCTSPKHIYYQFEIGCQLVHFFELKLQDVALVQSPLGEEFLASVQNLCQPGIVRNLGKLICSGNSSFQFIRKAIGWTVIIIEEFHSCLLHIKFFRTYFYRE